MPRSTFALKSLTSYSKSWPLVLIAICLSVSSLFVLRKSDAKESVNIVVSRPPVARLGDAITVKATNRANPAIHLSAGHEVLTPYRGPEKLRTALEQNQAEPLSLASADFDEDGVPDLITGYSFGGRGIVTLMRGNVDAIYPNSPEAQQRRADGTFTNAPFLSPASVLAATVPADFIGAGDFDGDSHWDVVIGSRDANSLYLLSGDGHGSLTATKQVALTGTVTAMITGEINRRDGLDDIIVGVSGKDGSSVAVFEGTEGALKSSPEIFPMPAPVSALALGQLDSSYEMDLAVGDGTQLMLIHGRDRKLSLDPQQQEKASPAEIEQKTFESEIQSLAIGDFADNHQPAVALLMGDGRVEVVKPTVSKTTPRKESSTQLNLSSWQTRTLNVPAASQARVLMRAKTSSMAGDDLLVLDQSQLQIFSNVAKDDATTTNLQASSDPVAVLPMRLNSDALTDLVVMQKGSSAPGVIKTEAAQTFIVNSTADTTDGQCTTAPNGCTLREAITAAQGNAGADTITFQIGSGVQTIALLSHLPLITDPVTIDATTQPGFAEGGGKPLIELNGASSSPNFAAFDIYAGSTTVRGFVINRIHSNGLTLLQGGGNIIEGNYIGTNVAGTAALANDFRGIGIGGDQTDPPSANNRIGGTTTQARNIISGNKVQGVRILNLPSSGNLVQGNYIGTDVTGTVAIGNLSEGIYIGGGVNNTIGGTTAGAGNVISSNGSSLSGRATSGIHIGTLPFATGATGNLVQGNRVGTNANGNAALRNAVEGVVFEDGASSNTIGGTTAAARNIISGNGTNGVDLGYQKKVTLNQVLGNYIGTDVTGNLPLGNLGYGIYINVNSDNNTIRDNRIAFNGLGGVFIPNDTPDPGDIAGVRIAIDTNQIYANGGLGIDLGLAGITPNDFKDPDIGGNLQQNFPLLTSALPPASAETVWERAGEVGREMPDPVLAAAQLTVSGTLNSAPNASFTVHWYFSADTQCTNNQTASQYLAGGKVDVMTNGNGDAQFSFPFDFPQGITAGTIHCTATGDGNTSEFSPCFPVTAPAATSTISSVSGSGTYGSTASLTATLTSNSTPVSGKTINFTVDGSSVCGGASQPACPQTNASGIATLNVSGYSAGGHPVVASFAGDSSYAGSNGNGTLTVSKATPTITWNNPADIVYGTALSSTQLNATASVPGTFAYTPAANTVLNPGSAQTLHVDFTPTDSTNYTTASKNVLINVTLLLFLETGTNNIAAVDSVTLTRGPFALTNTHNYSSDQRTRILFFTTNLGLPQTFQPNTSTLSVQIGVNSYPVESVGPNSTIGGSAIVFRLPDLSPGNYPLGIRLNGVNSSNAPNLQIISSPTSSPAAAPKSNKANLAEYLLFSILDLLL